MIEWAIYEEKNSSMSGGEKVLGKSHRRVKNAGKVCA